MTRQTRVRATAFAKVTLSLRVLGARPDGFHELDGLVVSVGQPQDAIEADVVGEPGVRLVLAGDETDVPKGDENLAVQAAERTLARAGRQALGVRLTLRKRIPPGAGLGGGSADAAATMLALRRLLELDLDDRVLADVAAELGSDVPFCLHGGAARMRGRGEQIEPLDVPLGLPLLVAVPPFRLATAEVYRAWDDLGGPRATRIVAAPPRLSAASGGLADLANDLEAAAEAIEPRMAGFREELEGATGRPAVLAGSGSGYVVPLDDPRSLPEVSVEVAAKVRGTVLGAATVSRGVRLEG